MWHFKGTALKTRRIEGHKWGLSWTDLLCRCRSRRCASRRSRCGRSRRRCSWSRRVPRDSWWSSRPPGDKDGHTTDHTTDHTSQQDGQHVLVYPPSHVSFSASLYFTSFTYFKNHNLNHTNVRYFNQTLDILKQEHINCLYFTRMKILYVKYLYTVENILLLLLITTLYCLLLSTSTYWLNTL